MAEHRGAVEATLRVSGLELAHAQVTPKTVWSFLRLGCADGTIGLGEASLMHGSESLDAPFRVVRKRLLGAPIADVLGEVDNAARDTLATAAIASALEQAIWDVQGRHAGVAAWTLLGGSAEPIALYANINRRTVERTPAGFFASAREARAAGFNAVKIAPFDDLTPAGVESAEGRALVERGIARAAATREAIGTSCALYIDCHWRFTPALALAAIDALAELGVVWFECPLPEREDTIADIAALRRYANVRGMRLAGLEELTSPDAFRPWLAAGAYDVVMPDVKYCGGLADLVAIGADAARHGVTCAPHNPTGPVSHAASLAACAALVRPVELEHQWDETPWFFRIGGATLPRPREGGTSLPTGPGLGVGLDLDGLPVRRD